MNKFEKKELRRQSKNWSDEVLKEKYGAAVFDSQTYINDTNDDLDKSEQLAYQKYLCEYAEFFKRLCKKRKIKI